MRTVADKQEPLWLDAVRKFERAIGDPIESIVTSEAYFDAMTRFKRTQSQVTGAVENAGNLVIFAESSAWSARLRFAIAELDGDIRRENSAIQKVSVRVMPRR